MKKNLFSKGTRVICHLKDAKWKRAVIMSQPKDEYGRFTDDFDWPEYVTVKIKDEDGKVFSTTMDNIEPDVDPGTLTDDEFKTLWNEISRGSIYYHHYKNSLGVFQNTAMNCYEGYWEELTDKMSEEEAYKQECAEGFAEYCRSIEYNY